MCDRRLCSIGQVWEETDLAAYDAREHPLRLHLVEEHDIRKHLPISRLLLSDLAV
jgi:hypothetical protein